MTLADGFLREQMPVTADWAYFDHAAVAPLPRPSAIAIQRWLTECVESGDVPWLFWNAQAETCRRLAAEAIGADPAEIALLPNTTAGIGLVAEGFAWEPGDEVLVPANEFPSNLYPWRNLERRGVRLKTLEPGPQGRLDLDQLADAIGPRTRVVSVSWVGFASGFRIDVGAVAKVCHDRGAFFFLDAIQGMGVFPLDVRRDGVDFLAADGHKWMLGPEGAGIFFVRRELLERLAPLNVGWNSVGGAGDFRPGEMRLKESASRYEGGTLNIAGFIGLAASLELLREWGLGTETSDVASRVLRITDFACERLESIGADIFSPREVEREKSGIVSFSLREAVPAEARKKCLDAGVVLSVRDGRLRIAPHAYNDEADVARLIEALRS
ncbi:MAG TPA: aminotransferase class V-fold PLP-dependent enzyme [Pirellulaceae bacterium]|jgi:selenocysteine lyase/cysteine desulfurase|nr:aminotransferase class V-fold PLP-dependent enzyme [Pirellulaceae bacterium]